MRDAEKHKQSLRNAWADGKYANRDTTNMGKNQNWTEERRAKHSEIAKNRQKLICPHCGLEASPAMAKRWHFDNCRTLHK